MQDRISALILGVSLLGAAFVARPEEHSEASRFVRMDSRVEGAGTVFAVLDTTTGEVCFTSLGPSRMLSTGEQLTAPRCAKTFGADSTTAGS